MIWQGGGPQRRRRRRRQLLLFFLPLLHHHRGGTTPKHFHFTGCGPESVCKKVKMLSSAGIAFSVPFANRSSSSSVLLSLLLPLVPPDSGAPVDTAGLRRLQKPTIGY
uniref:Putative secreted protein n=1 Tax=Anopheles marajoara TaxID=58244 RepID=A0A2M4C881_9DIPT